MNKKKVKDFILKEAIKSGIDIKDVHKKIRVNSRKTYIPIKSFSIEEAFFKPCIYYLIAGKTVVYIGETESLMTRLGQHLTENVKVFDNISFVWFEGSKKERFQKEKEEIEFHKPHYNVIHNGWKFERTKEEKEAYKKVTQPRRMKALLDKISKNLEKNI